MTAPDVRCGATVRRCTGCENTVGGTWDVCGRCGGHEIVESTCRRLPLAGRTRCRLHGGATVQAARRATAAEVEAGARRALAKLGAPEPIGHPVDELLAVAAQRKQWLATIRGLLPELDSLASVDSFGVERARAVVALFVDALNDSQRSLEGLVKLDLEARRQALDEAQARLVWSAVDRGLRAAIPVEPEYVRVRASVGKAARDLLGAEQLRKAAAGDGAVEDMVWRAVDHSCSTLAPADGARFRAALSACLAAAAAGGPLPDVPPPPPAFPALPPAPVVVAETVGPADGPAEPAVVAAEPSEGPEVVGGSVEPVAEAPAPAERLRRPRGARLSNVHVRTGAGDRPDDDVWDGGRSPDHGPPAPEGSWLGWERRS